MNKFRKYQFASESEADAKIVALGVDEENSHKHQIVKLGNLIIEQATYDEEGNELTPPVLSDTYHLDVLWNGDAESSWDANLVWCPPMGAHVFGSSSAIAEWTEKCKELHPEFFPEPEVIE